MDTLRLFVVLTNQTNPPPPTTEQVNSGLIYVIAAYAVIWLLIFGYLYTIQRRQAQLKREIELLKEEEANPGASNPAQVSAGKSGSQDLG